MPIQITWSPNHVFISSSSPSDNLSLFRVELFAPPKGQKKDLVCFPRESLLLPKSARSAKVHYFAPRPQDTRALVCIGSSASAKNDEAKNDNKADKDESAVDNRISKDEKVGDHVANDKIPKSDPTKDVKQKDQIPQDDKAQAKKLKDNKSEDTKTFSPPLLFYLNVETDLGGWVLSDAIEEIKSNTAKGSLEPKMDKFIKDDCCC